METKYKDLSDQGWGEMEQLLDKHMPERNRKIGWWLIPIGITTALSLWYLLQQPTAPVKLVKQEIEQLGSGLNSDKNETSSINSWPLEQEGNVITDRSLSTEITTGNDVLEMKRSDKNLDTGSAVGNQKKQIEERLRNVVQSTNDKEAREVPIYPAEAKTQGRSLTQTKEHIIENPAIHINSSDRLFEDSEELDKQEVMDSYIVSVLPKYPLVPIRVIPAIRKAEINPIQEHKSRLSWFAGASLIQSLSSANRSLGVELGLNIPIVNRLSLITKVGVNRSFYDEQIGEESEVLSSPNPAPSPGPRVGVELNGCFLDPTIGLGLGYSPTKNLMLFSGLQGHFLSSRTSIDNLKSINSEPVNVEYLKDNGVEFDQADQEFKIRLLDHFSLDSGVQLNIAKGFYTQVGLEYRINRVSDALDDLRKQAYFTAGIRF